MTDWTFGRLTTKEAQRVLKANALPENAGDWSAIQIQQASRLLDEAVQQKRAKIVAKRSQELGQWK